MSVAITLDNINVLLTPSHKSHDAFFQSHIEQFQQSNAEIDAIIVASSSDLTFLTCQHSQNLLAQLLQAFPHATSDIITQGCLGLYAAILHVIAHPNIKSALVVMIETPYESLQGGLNASKLGKAFGQKGMSAKPGVGLCCVNRKELSALTEEDLIVDVSEILSKADGLSANPIFLKRFVERIQSLHHEYECKMVSFEIQADLAKLFLRFLQPELDKCGLGDTWLPSYEQDEQHIFSLKPLMEIQRYQHHLDNTPLVTFGLGAGGRIGILRVTRRAHLNPTIDHIEPVPRHPPVLVEQDLTTLYQKTCEAIESYAPEKAYYQRGKEIMLTLDKAYFGIDNLYFRMPINLTLLNELGVSKNRAMETIIPEAIILETELTH